MTVDPAELVGERLARLQRVMCEERVDALLTCDPFSIRYATGTRNMLVHGLTGPDRLALIYRDGASVLWEFAGCEHLVDGAAHVGEVRLAPALNAKKSTEWRGEVDRFAADVACLVRDRVGSDAVVGVDRLEAPVVGALGRASVAAVDGVGVVQAAMALKQPSELAAMRRAMDLTERAALEMQAAIEPGRTEQEVWAEFHRALIAGGGELVVTRLLQAGERTFPYFQEASAHAMGAGDLVCFDSDAVAMGGYSVDFSRTFLCGEVQPTADQRFLYAMALEQLEHNAANLAAGRSFRSFAAAAYDVPEPYVRYGYYQLAHGLGLAGGHPNIPRLGDGPYPLDGDIEPGMVLCVESYVGDPATRQGVKLENQFLVHDGWVEQMSTYPLEQRLM